MNPYILNKKDEFKPILCLSVPLLIILVACLFFLIHMNADYKAILGCILLSSSLLPGIIDYISFIKNGNNYPTLIINHDGIYIKKNNIKRMIKWKEVENISLYLGKSRLEGLVMSISTARKEKVTFSFVQYSIGFHVYQLIDSIKFFSNNPDIVEIKGIYRWIKKIW
jgi:hypothetical protein